MNKSPEVLMKYVHNRKGRKVGMLTADLSTPSNVSIGWSRCHAGDEFSREEGLKQATQNFGLPVPHSFLKAAKQFRIDAFLRFNVRVQLVTAMSNGLQPRISKPGTQRNSGHRKGCPRLNKKSRAKCKCRQLALIGRPWTTRELNPFDKVSQPLGRITRSHG